MKKTKTIIQYLDSCFSISIDVDVNGKIKNRNKLQYPSHMNRKEYFKKYNKENKEIITQQKAEYRKNNLKIILVNEKKYRKENKEQIKKRHEKNKEYYQEYYKDERWKKYYKQYYIKNKEQIILNSAKWSKENLDKVSIYNAKSRAERNEWGEPEPLNDWFKGSELHHTHRDGDTKECINIPVELHKGTWHSFKKPETMKEINKLAFEFMCH